MFPVKEEDDLIGRLGVTVVGEGENQEVVFGKIVDESITQCDGVLHKRVGIGFDGGPLKGHVLYAARKDVLVGD